MSNPGTFNNPSFGGSDLKDETLKLALAEGHDADIPSNAGVYHASPSKEAQTVVATSTTTIGEEDDANIVDWEKPIDKDPANPMNWSEAKKWMNIGIVSFITLITFVFPFFISLSSSLTKKTVLSRRACSPLACHRC
jgi:hypothetical protein